MVDWLKVNPTIKLAFNPGSWQLRTDYKNIEEIMKLSYLISVNREEAEKLTNFGESGGRDRDLLIALNKKLIFKLRLCVPTFFRKFV